MIQVDFIGAVVLAICFLIWSLTLGVVMYNRGHASGSKDMINLTRLATKIRRDRIKNG